MSKHLLEKVGIVQEATEADLDAIEKSWPDPTPPKEERERNEVFFAEFNREADEITKEDAFPFKYGYNRDCDGVDEVFNIWNVPEDRVVCSIHFWEEAEGCEAEARELVTGLNDGTITEAQAMEQNPPVEWVPVSDEERKMHVEKSRASVAAMNEPDLFDQHLAKAASRGKQEKPRDRGLEME